MPRLTSRLRRAPKEESETVTRGERIQAIVRIVMLAFLMVRLVRSIRRLPKDVALLRKPVAAASA